MEKYKDLTDDELIALMKLSNKLAFGEIYDRYWKKLFTAAANKLQDLEEAEDVVQQLFVTFWDRRESIEIRASLSSYLGVAVKYRVIKSLDKRFRQRRYSEELFISSVVNQLDDTTQEWLEFAEIRSRIDKVVAELPKKCRMVYQMSRENGYSQKQIAASLDIAEKTVEAHMSKAIKTLKSHFKDFFTLL